MSATTHPQSNPMVTVVPHGYQSPITPRRYLDPDIAQSIADAKARTGLSWRQIARLTGVSHPHLVLLSQGRRVPSLHTANQIVMVLPLSASEAAALRGSAVEDRGKSRRLG